MLGSRLARVAAVASCASLIEAQTVWAQDQVNTTMCSWNELRAAVVRDTVYLDGGYIWWLPGMKDGSTGSIEADLNPLGIVWTLNFSVAFNVSQNVTALMDMVPKGLGGAVNNIAPNYVDGAMLANNDEWFVYGGLLVQTRDLSPPPKDQGYGYQKYQYGADKTFSPGLVQYALPDDMTRYVAYGGGASAPSENKAWYFGGMRTPAGGPIYYLNNITNTPTNVSNTIMTVDFTNQGRETWSNKTLPDSVPSRANPEVVWVPIGAQGILVVLGGVDYPEWNNANRLSSNPAQSKINSPGYMSSIDIYDIANDKWYQQDTVLGPGQLARGCAVVAPAKDYSSFNIYYYGGYDGLDGTSTYNDDIWVLSLPSFMWMKVHQGQSGHARAGHKCVMPYPDQMMVIGGYTNLTTNCVQDGIVQMFNLTSVAWMDGYDPTKYYDYGVPEMIHNMIGGNRDGGATMVTPTPTGWADPSLAEVFKTPYPTSKLTTYYPYQPAASANNTNPGVPAGGGGSGGGGLPSWAPIVLGVVLGLVFLTCVGVAILFWRRRKYFRRGMSEAGTEDTNGHRILSWMRGQQSEAKAPTVTTDEMPTSPEADHVGMYQHQQFYHPASIMEMDDTQVLRAELPDTSQPMELHDEALTPQEIIAKHTNLGDNGSSSGLNPSSYSDISPPDRASTISQSTGAGGAIPPSLNRPAAPTHISFENPARRAESPALSSSGMDPAQSQAAVATAVSPTTTRRFESGVSGVSEVDRTHLRHISDTTVSSFHSNGDRVTGMQQAPNSVPAPVPEQVTPGSPSPGESAGPVSPPSAGVVTGIDYVSARQSLGSNGGSGASPLRRSIFQEHHEDLGEGQDQGGHGGGTV